MTAPPPGVYQKISDNEWVFFSPRTKAYYAIRPLEGYCDCADRHYRNRECKHLRRVRQYELKKSVPFLTSSNILE